MRPERAVVLSMGSAGGRASAWLARRGVAVRHLGMDGSNGRIAFDDPVEPAAIHGDAATVGSWIGSAIDVTARRGIWIRGQLHPMPTRRRQLAALCDGSSWGLAVDLRPRGRPPRSIDAWGPRHFGQVAYQRLLRPLFAKRLGASPAEVSADLAALLVGSARGRWWAPSDDPAAAAAQRTEAVLDAGGEALQDVEVHGLEVEGGRITAVMTEFGREHVPDRLYTDLPARSLVRLLPSDVLSQGDRAALDALPVTTRARVDLRVEAASLPWSVWVAGADVAALQVRRFVGRSGEPRPDRVRVDLCHAPPDEEAGRLARRIVSTMATVKGVIAVSRHLVPCPPSPAGAAALRRLWDLGIVAVGAAALHLPLGVGQEADLGIRGVNHADPLGGLTAPTSVRGRSWLP